jgi:predicted phage terminase large subunit-like protein
MTKSKIMGLLDKHRPIVALLFDDKANGPAVIERLKANIPGVVAINPKGGKVARMFAAAPEWQAGDWYVGRRAASTECLVEQLTMFPAGRYDDMVDGMTQAACWLASYQLPTVESHNAFTGEVNWSLNSGVWRING